MDTKKLTAILKGLDTFTSSDKFRGNLAFIRAASETRLEATDGHRLAVVFVDGGHGLALGSYDGSASIKRLAAGVTPEIAREDVSWPDTQAVIDSVSGEYAGQTTSETFINPWLLAEVAKGLATVCGLSKNFTPAVKIRLGAGSLSPIRFDLSHDGVTAIALLMPMRG